MSATPIHLNGFPLKARISTTRLQRIQPAPGPGSAVAKRAVKVSPPLLVPETPPDAVQRIQGGAHSSLLAPDTVTFVLYAPWKPYVSLVGDFNEWNTLRHPMQTDGAGLWWITIPHPGDTRYGYYVAIDADSHVWVGDPYAREVDWHGSDAWARLRAPASEHEWQDSEWRTPALRDMVIYELCLRDFGGRWEGSRQRYGTMEDLRRRAGYLRYLGVNAVELMPIQAFPGDSSWGYNPVFYFAPAQTYGTPEDFKRLVDTLHGEGIAVILDVAFNHAWGAHPWYRIYPEMYGRHGEWLPNLNPFFHQTPGSVNSWGGVDWDHFTERTTRYFQDVVRYWLSEFHVDGLRFDWTCGVDFDSRDPMNPGFNPFHGISALAWAARQVKPDVALIGEFWQLDGTNPDKTAARLVRETPVDAVWNGAFHHTMDNVLNQRWEWEKQDIKAAVGGYLSSGFREASELVNYTCSHDEVRPEHEIQYYTGRWIARPDNMPLTDLALQIATLGLVVLFSAAGVPMIYAGQEFGENGARTVDFQALQWGRLEDVRGAEHFKLMQRLIRARRSHAALRSDNIACGEEDFASVRLLQIRRWDEYGDAAVAILNFSPFARTVAAGLPWAGRWYDAVTDRVYDAESTLLTLELAPYGAALLMVGQDDRP